MDKKSQMVLTLFPYLLAISTFLILAWNFLGSDCIPKTSDLTIVNGEPQDSKIKWKFECFDALWIKGRTWLISFGLILLYLAGSHGLLRLPNRNK